MKITPTVARRCEFSWICSDVSEEPSDDDKNKYIQGRGYHGGKAAAARGSGVLGEAK